VLADQSDHVQDGQLTAAEVRTCARCSRPALDDSDWCQRCERKERRRIADAVARLRAGRLKAKLCQYCGKVRVEKGEISCPRCRIKRNRTATLCKDRVTRDVTKPEITADGKLREGQARRGRQTTANLDEQDLLDVIKLVTRCRDELALVRSEAYKWMPAVQRKDAERQALSRLRLAAGFVDEVLGRNGEDPL
jgi:hypothetical protein